MLYLKCLALVILSMFASLDAIDIRKDFEELERRFIELRFEVKKAKVGDVELAYYMRGQGKPLIMIMGFKGTMGMWDPGLLEQLEKHYQLILFDNRGVGLSSDTPENHTTISQMAEDTYGLIKTLNYNQVYVLGWSMGVRIAEELTLRHPEVVEKVILCAPDAALSQQTPMTKQLSEFRQPHTSVEEELALIFPTNPQGKQAADAYYNRLKRGVIEGTIPFDIKISQEAIQRQTRSRLIWDAQATFKALATIKQPVLVAGGIDDRLVTAHDARLTANQIPFAWMAFFEGGHAFLFQSIERFSDLVFVFLD